MEAKKQDLRVQKTLAAINRAFEEMVCTMPPQEITVKELTAVSYTHLTLPTILRV